MVQSNNGDAPTHVAYELREVNDGIQVTLSWTHRKFLKLLSERAGEVYFDWDLVTGEAKSHLLKLKDMALVTAVPVVGQNRSLIRLTDMGRNIVTKIIQAGD